MKKLCLLLTIICIACPDAQAKRKITFNDLFAYPMVGDFRLSPNGSKIAFVLTEHDTLTGESHSSIHIVDSHGGKPRKLTNRIEHVSNVRWSPNGNCILFISNRDTDSNQAWRINIDGGESARVTSISTGVSNAEWFPDGQRILFTSNVFPGCPTDSCNQAEQKKRDERQTSGMLYDKLPFRHYNHWLGDKVGHLIVHDLRDGSYKDITPEEVEVPPFALAGSPYYSIHPDGEHISFVTNTDSNLALSTNNDIFILNLRDSSLTRLTENEGNDTSPVYSPNGRYLAYLSMSRPGYESDRRRLLIYDIGKRELRDLTPDFHLSVGGIRWAPDSKDIYFSAIERGGNSLFKVSIGGGKIQRILDGTVRWNYQVFPDDRRIAYIQIMPDRPAELFVYDTKDETEARLTYYTEEPFSHINIEPAQNFWFKGADDVRIQGYLTLPTDFDPDNKYPLVLLIHGGPQWTWLDEFNFYGWNKYLVAAQGYAVAQIDPHGSVGYGQEFTDAVSGDWGGKDYTDLMLGIDFLINKHDFIDGSRLAAMGRSYGGFMVNWIAGQTDRFKCLVCVDGLFDHVFAYLTTEELWFPEWEFNGTPWENPDLYIERSPSTYLNNIRTPILFVHGQKDYRVDISQALSGFTALQRKGVDSQLLYFPNEGHSIHQMKNLEYFYEVQFDWLAKYLKE
ncbi:MAG: prolyl oligopeptidase family serine peptidase [candidate division Zixibacteria bacterium]|nr:prolyl oligopeptidase family serine peptidase [candidate division Zixibacteria bacterium]